MSQNSDKPPGNVGLFRLPVEKPEPAVQFLYEHGGGVMDLIAHFWERLPQTPPLLRDDLHLVVAGPERNSNESSYLTISSNICDAADFCGAMLYVPKAHRADVLALTPECAAGFARYIALAGLPVRTALVEAVAAAGVVIESSGGPVSDGAEQAAGSNGSAGRIAIDFLTGGADGLNAMVPHLLPLVHKKVPVRQLVNVVMQLPANAAAETSGEVRVAKETDVPILNRWRKMYKEERGILFDANLDAGVATQKIFVLEHENQVVAAAKFDLELNRLVEIGGVFTFPEYRKNGFGRRLVSDLACRIRAMNKQPTLQVDQENKAATSMYERLGWKSVGELARVWLTG